MVANAVDYHRYWRAVNCAKILGPEGLQALFAVCDEIGRTGHKRLEGSEVPAVLRSFRPDWASIDQRYAQFGLYSHGEASVFLTLETFDDNQRATVNNYVRGARTTPPFWIKYPEKYHAPHPTERIVTLGQGSMHEYSEWIILSDRMLIASYPGTGGESLVAEVRLAEPAQREIARTIAEIKPGIRGRSYTSGSSDGITLSIVFSPNGEPGNDDIALANTWRDEVGPLVDAIARLSPAAFPLSASTYLRAGEHGDLKYQTSRTWAEVAKQDRPRLPWWCLWPRFLK